MKNFRFLTGDINWQTYGGKWYRRIAPEAYHVLELINMDDACGRDNEGQPTYIVELSLIDLNEVEADGFKSAFRCCGMEKPEHVHGDFDGIRTMLASGFTACNPDTWTNNEQLLAVEFLDSYGLKAPLWSDSGNAYAPLLKAGRVASREFVGDALEERLERPVNRIGSTAREFARGDMTSAIIRGVMRGDKTARICAKVQSGGKLTDADLDSMIDPGLS